ncbi:MAG: RNA polymerase Rpb4 [Nitrososphaerota archaeon]
MVNEISRKAITIHEAKELLANLDQEKADQIQKRTLDYVSKFSKIQGNQAAELVNRLVKEVGLTEPQAVELVNILPKTKEEIRTFTVGWRQLSPSETLDKILEIISSAAKTNT